MFGGEYIKPSRHTSSDIPIDYWLLFPIHGISLVRCIPSNYQYGMIYKINDILIAVPNIFLVYTSLVMLVLGCCSLLSGRQRLITLTLTPERRHNSQPHHRNEDSFVLTAIDIPSAAVVVVVRQGGCRSTSRASNRTRDSLGAREWTNMLLLCSCLVDHIAICLVWILWLMFASLLVRYPVQQISSPPLISS